jgi:lipopolysaccharide biosynthesis glycosyltransferase
VDSVSIELFREKSPHREDIAETTSPDIIKIFVGVDGPRTLAAEVLKYSILKNTNREVQFYHLDHANLSELLQTHDINPAALKAVMYTGFSLYRWAIPMLCGRKGKAIYMDADIFNFHDIGDLWDLPVGDHTHLQVSKFSSVMLFDCEKANWDFGDICSKIMANYKKYYRKFMFSNKHLSTGERRGPLDPEWNHLDVFRENTKMIHYTRVRTQPWSYLKHPHGQPYYDLMNECLDLGILTEGDISKSISAKGCHRDILERLGR